MNETGSRSAAQLRWFALSALIVLIDQASKWAIVSRLQFGERIPLLADLFDLTLVYNTGAAFSFLAGAGGWQRWFFTVLGLVAAGVIARLLYRARAEPLLSLALALIMGGALGNVLDRLVHAKVVDFLLVHYGDWYFPAFNLADSAITAGATALVIDELARLRRRR